MNKASTVHRPALIGAAEGDELHAIDPRIFLLKIAVLLTWMAVAGTGVLILDGPVKLGFQVLLSIGLAHATELVHQCLHRTATGLTVWDRAFGIFLGLPALVSYWNYLYCHFQHHRFNGTTRDGESFGYHIEWIESDRMGDRLLGMLLQLSMAGHFAAAMRNMALAITGRLRDRLAAEVPAMPSRMAARIEANYRLMAGIAALSVAAAVAAGAPGLVVDLWIVPLALWAPIHALIELPEHVLCDHPEGDTRRNTRSISSGPIISWITNFNGRHVGHHDDPRVPPERLADHEVRLRREDEFGHIELSYRGFYIKFFRYLIDGRPF